MTHALVPTWNNETCESMSGSEKEKKQKPNEDPESGKVCNSVPTTSDVGYAQSQPKLNTILSCGYTTSPSPPFKFLSLFLLLCRYISVFIAATLQLSNGLSSRIQGQEMRGGCEMNRSECSLSLPPIPSPGAYVSTALVAELTLFQQQPWHLPRLWLLSHMSYHVASCIQEEVVSVMRLKLAPRSEAGNEIREFGIFLFSLFGTICYSLSLPSIDKIEEQDLWSFRHDLQHHNN